MRKVNVLLALGLVGFGLTASARAGDQTAAPANAAVLSIKAAQSSVQPGGTVSFDVFVTNARDVAVFQLQMEATGGDRGSLTVEGMKVDKTRPDFVFGTAEVLDAADMVNGRVGALRYNGGSNVDKPAYLATFTFKASADAQGTFRVNFKSGDETFLNDSGAVLIPHSKSAGVEVAAGRPVAKTREEERGGRK